MKTDKRTLVLLVDAKRPNDAPREWTYYDWLDDDDDYIIVSEPLDVEFTMLPDEKVVEKKLAGLKAREDIETERHAKVINALQEERSKLTAITYQEPA